MENENKGAQGAQGQGQSNPPQGEGNAQGQQTPPATEQQAGQQGGTATPPASGEGGSNTPPKAEEKSFTQNQVNDIVRTRLEQEREAVYKRYGVKGKDELEALIGKGQGFDALKKTSDDVAAENKSLKERMAFMNCNIEPKREEDIRVHFKGKGIEFTEENLKKELTTHPEWLKAPDGKQTPQTTITQLGSDHQHQDTKETDDEKMKRVFGA